VITSATSSGLAMWMSARLAADVVRFIGRRARRGAAPTAA